jgi:SAM-dependent methyltransferase
MTDRRPTSFWSRKDTRRSDEGDSERHKSEQAFHNDRVISDTRGAQSKYYIAVGHAKKRFAEIISYYGRNKDVLEIGCFDGKCAVEYAEYSRSYTGIDISDKAIAKANNRALPRKYGFYVRDACASGYPDSSYDCIIAQGNRLSAGWFNNCVV